MTEYSVPFGARVPNDFLHRLFVLCNEAGWTINPYAGYVMACVAFESAKTFSPSVKNGAGSGAVGLIQFMPATARSLGTDTLALSKMSALEQLEYVFKYLTNCHMNSRISSLEDMYMSILLPSAIGKPLDYVLFKSGTKAYQQNKALDKAGKGYVTKADAAAQVVAMHAEGLKECNRKVVIL